MNPDLSIVNPEPKAGTAQAHESECQSLNTPNSPLAVLTFKFDAEVNLRTPLHAAPIVKIKMTPANAHCLFYGTAADGNIGYTQIKGSKDRFELPFRAPTIYVKYLIGAQSIEITPLGWAPISPPPEASVISKE